MTLRNYPVWRKPRHHLDARDASNHVHWVELFFDLVHVVTIFMLGNFLSNHLDVHGFMVFSGIFLAVFFAWADSSIYNSLYISTDIPHRTLMAVQIVTMMVIAAAIPDILEGGWGYFALGYAFNRALTAYLYWRARRVGAEATSLAAEQGRNFFILAGLFALSAVLPRPFAYWVFGAGIVLIQLQYILPRIGTLRFERFRPRLHHISERFGLLMLILLGEGFFKLVVTLSQKSISAVGPDTLINFIMGGLSLFALAWIYFDCVGNAQPKSRKTSLIVTYWLAHIAIMWSAVLVGVALAGEVYVGFMEPYPLGYGMIGNIGLVVFLGSLWVLQHVVEGRDITRLYHSAGIRAFGIAAALLLLAIFPYVPSMVGNLVWGVALFSQIVVPFYRAVRDGDAGTTDISP